jgi:hypothetical protein
MGALSRALSQPCHDNPEVAEELFTSLEATLSMRGQFAVFKAPDQWRLSFGTDESLLEESGFCQIACGLIALVSSALMYSHHRKMETDKNEEPSAKADYEVQIGTS